MILSVQSRVTIQEDSVSTSSSISASVPRYTVAFDLHETLWSEHAAPRRALLMAALYRALHASGWRVIIVSWSASPPDDRERDRRWRYGILESLNIPSPDAFHICYEDGKLHWLKQEGVDLLIDDSSHWINDAAAHGMFTLALGGTGS